MAFESGSVSGLPYEAINRNLKLNLKHGTVHVSEETLRHIKARHPADFDLCSAHLVSVIQKPDYIGQGPHYSTSFEVVKVLAQGIVLVAISSVPDEYGDYPVESSYVIPRGAIQRRLRKKHLFLA